MDIENYEPNIIELLQKSSLFSSLSIQQLEKLVPLFRIQEHETGEFIINENDPPIDLYVLWEGEVEVLKKSGEDDVQLRISTIKEGEVIGEMGLLDHSPRSASIRTLTPTKLLAVAIEDLKTLANDGLFYDQLIEKLTEVVKDLRLTSKEQPVYFSLISNLATMLSNRMRTTNQVTVESLRSELELNKTRVAMSKFLLNILILLSMYMYALKFIDKIAVTTVSTTIITTPIIIVFGIAVLFNMKTSGYSMEFYGFSLKNWRRAVTEALIISVALILFIMLVKWILITNVARFSHLTMLHFTGGTSADGQFSLTLLIELIIAYLVFTPIQELICRSALQGPLQEFLIGPNRVYWAIIMSNILFSVTHLHISISMAFVVLLPGLLWGWLYSRYKTLVGVSLSHLIVGGVGFFVLDIKSLLVF